LKAFGIFGSVWYMLSAYPNFWITPCIINGFARDFIADAKAGRVDGYTRNLISDMWKPSVYLWFAEELLKRATRATA
jgi:hypothetical protein